MFKLFSCRINLNLGIVYIVTYLVYHILSLFLKIQDILMTYYGNSYQNLQ